MRKIIIILAAILTITLIVFLDFNIYKKNSKDTLCEDKDIIFSITTFDGKTETQPFVKCLGHTWVSLENKTGHTIKLFDYEIANNETLTFSIWAITGHRGVVFNLEANFISKYNRYDERISLSVNILEDSLKVIEDYINANDNWTLGKNCSKWSIELWNRLVGSDYKLKKQILMYTPKRLQKSLKEYKNCIKNKEFQNFGSIFIYENGSRTELNLC